MPRFKVTAISTINRHHVAIVEVVAVDAHGALLKARKMHTRGELQWHPAADTAAGATFDVLPMECWDAPAPPTFRRRRTTKE